MRVVTLALMIGVVGLACTKDTPLPDLSARLEAGETRAGQISDESALFGGVSSEGRIGDWKIYNSRAQFIIQGDRPGDFYVDQGGGVIDADVVREEGHPGCDVVDEWTGMYGFGRLIKPTEFNLLSDGSDGTDAVLEVRGVESVMELITGAAESDALVPNLGLEMVTTYTLSPDTPMLKVTSEVTATVQAVNVNIGDILLASMDVALLWEPGVGYEGPNSSPRRFTSYVSQPVAGAVALIGPKGEDTSMGGIQLLAELTDLAAISSDVVALDPGASFSFTRYYAVGHDLAEITDAIVALDELPVESYSTTVEAPDGPVAGARVTVLVDGLPWSQAISNKDGVISLQVPSGRDVTVEVDGRGMGMRRDVPSGASYFSPYAVQRIQNEVLEDLKEGGPLRPMAEGRGTSQGELLKIPATLIIDAGDGLPFEARLTPLDGNPALDRRIYPGRPGGEGLLTWATDGDVQLNVAPGSYRVHVHRGIRFERQEFDVTLSAGEVQTQSVTLEQAYTHAGYLLGDPHSHSAPSNDAAVPMSERLMVSAGVGLQMHFGTDHDHVADYNPLIGPMGLSEWLVSVVSSEMSPVVRGHINLYPLEQLETANGGAWLWWSNRVTSTEEQMALLRGHYPNEFRIQLNHPLDTGLGESAKWSPGKIGNAEKWSVDFDTIEILNAGRYDKYLPFYLDLFGRGVLSAPTGTSDSHSHTGGQVGLSATFFGMGTNVVADYSDEILREAIDTRHTIVTRGPFLDMSIAPGSVISTADTLEVKALTPSWIQVDRLQLWKDGEVVTTAEGNEATFELAPEADSYYVVMAEGDSAMGGVWGGQTPWAMSSPILFDVGGDGWTPPLAPLEMD